MRRRALEGAIVLLSLLVFAAFVLPIDLIIFQRSWTPDPYVVLAMGALLGAGGLGWYARRPADKRPANIANRWVGLPVLLVGAGFAVSFGMVSLSSGLLIPLGHGLFFGSRGPMIVEVATNVFAPESRRTPRHCPYSLYLDDDRVNYDMIFWHRRICFWSEETKRLAMEQGPRAYLALSGWGSDRAFLYWSVAPASAPPPDSPSSP